MEELINDIIAAIEDIVMEEQSNRLSYRDFENLKRKFKNKISIHSGATRWCIALKNYDYVLKMPYYGSCGNRDYCEMEVRNYKKGCEMRIDKVLLPIEQIAIVGEFDYCLPIYKQVKYTSSWNDVDDKTINSFCDTMNKTFRHTKASKYIQKDRAALYSPRGVEYEFLARIMQLYGKKFLLNFVKWTKEAKVNDLHQGNYGFKGKKPVLIDYAGYFG